MPITISAAIAPLRTGVESNEIDYPGALAADAAAPARTVFRRSAVIPSNPPEHN
jgi:hypothetical protein